MDSYQLSHTIVICTRSRKESLSDCLDSILNNENTFEVIVVFNGVSETEFEILKNELFVNYPQMLNVLHSSPGLTHARNHALDHIKTDLVTFLDDDVVVPKDFHVKLLKYFSSNNKIYGASPRIRNLYHDEKRSIVKKYFQSIKYGKITRSGRNFWIPDANNLKIERIDWLPGCCMTYRMQAIGKLRFSTQLENGPSGGYALGEDVDFSMQIGNLGYIQTFSIDHRQAPSVRDSSKVMALASGHWHGYLINTYPHRVSKHRTLLTEYFHCGYLLARIVILKRNSRHDFVNKCLEIRAIYTELRQPTLVKNPKLEK